MVLEAKMGKSRRSWVSNPNGLTYNQRNGLTLSSEAPGPEREQKNEANIIESVAKPVSRRWSTTPLGKCHSRHRLVGTARLFKGGNVQ